MKPSIIQLSPEGKVNSGGYMLWFKFILGLMFFELVSILLAFVPDYGNEYTTKENKN